MGQVIKAYLGFFFILLEALLGIGIVTAGADTAAAQNYHADVVSEIEAGNFSPSVIAACKSQAEAEGYELEITPMVYDADHNVQLAEVRMKYQYTIQALELVSDKEIRGFAR